MTTRTHERSGRVCLSRLSSMAFSHLGHRMLGFLLVGSLAALHTSSSSVMLLGSAFVVPSSPDATAMTKTTRQCDKGHGSGCYRSSCNGSCRRRALSSSSTNDDTADAASSDATTTPTTAVVDNDDTTVLRVALTREDGKNGKLRRALTHAWTNVDATSTTTRLDLVELPCIAHADGPDAARLSTTLHSREWEYVVITSPQAARVLAASWKCNNNNTEDDSTHQPFCCKVAAVGKATEQTLRDFGIHVDVCPSKATAKVLAQELPFPNDKEYDNDDNDPPYILYPASAQAKQTLQQGLEARGFVVERLDTYDTVPAVWSDEQMEQVVVAATAASASSSITTNAVQIACFASPSAVRGWVQNTDSSTTDVGATTVLPKGRPLAACIGETSAEECRVQGWPEESIVYPDRPGLDGWVQAVQRAAEQLR